MLNTSQESRKQKRYKVNDKVVALSFDDACRVTDISIGGAAIKCMGRSTLPSRWSLDILMMGGNFHASIPVRLAWEKTVESTPYSTVFTKNVGVEFDNLTPENRSKVDHLIKMHEEYAM